MMEIQDSGKFSFKHLMKKSIDQLKQAKFTGKEKARHIVIIAVEGLLRGDFQNIIKFPIFQKLKIEGAYSDQLTSIYPTMTYPVLTSLVTGVYPNQHGIIHNQPFQPGISDEQKIWYNYCSEMKRKAIYDFMQERHFKTAALNWPVTGNSVITYNIPEITALKSENHHLKLLRAGSPIFLLSQELRYIPVDKKIPEYMQDSFYSQIACRTLQRKKPHLLLLRLNALRKLKKKYGVCYGDQQKYVLQKYNDLLEKMIDITKQAKIFSDTVFIFVSVNSQIDIHTHVYLNNILEREDLIANRGTYIDYQACFQSTGNGAYLYVKNNHLATEKHVREILEELKEAGIYGIKEIHTRNDLKKIHADVGIAMAVEGKSGFRFMDGFHAEDIVYLDAPDATSGYNPRASTYQNILFMYGNSIIPDTDLQAVELVDLVPTVSYLLDMDVWGGDGRILHEAIKKS